MGRPREREKVAWQVARCDRENLGGGGGHGALVVAVQGRPQPLDRRVLRASPLGLQRREARRHGRPDVVEVSRERRRASVPERPRDPVQADPVARQRVGLLSRRELHAVLDATEQQVRVGQVPLLALGHVAARAQAAKRVDGVRDTHARLGAAPDELQALGEELDLADPAWTDLRVLVGPRARLGARPREERRHLVREARIDGAAPHEGGQRVEETLAEGDVAGDRPGADQRRALPGSTPGLVVTLGGDEGVDERTARPLRTQAEVDAPDDAVVGSLVQGRDETLRDGQRVKYSCSDRLASGAPAAPTASPDGRSDPTRPSSVS